MNRYFFDLRRGEEIISDDEGTSFNSADDARAYAVKAVQEMAAEIIKGGSDVGEEHLDVSGEDRRLLFSISFHETIQDRLRK
jgi:hypothetical protein